MRFGVDIHFAVKDVEAVAAKKVKGRRRPLSAPAVPAVSAAVAVRTSPKQPKQPKETAAVSMQAQMKAPSPKQPNYVSLIEQYKPQFGRKQSSSGAPPPLPLNVARGTNRAQEEKEEADDPIESEPMKLPSKYPIKNTSNVSSLSNKTRIDPKTKWTNDSSSSSAATAAVRWDINVICEDRDLSLMAQDYKISEYNLKHPILFPPQAPHPEARLVASDMRVGKRDTRLGVGRKRLEHFSVGKAINDPMPFYPFLHEGNCYNIAVVAFVVVSASA